MTREAMNFDLSLVEIPVTITKRDGTKKKCILREASEDTVCQYNNARTDCVRYGKEGNISGSHNIHDITPMLVALCMVELEEGADGSIVQEKQIQITEVRTWRHSVVESLFKKAKEISAIDDDSKDSLLKQRADIDEQLKNIEESEEKTKKLESDMTAGSG